MRTSYKILALTVVGLLLKTPTLTAESDVYVSWPPIEPDKCIAAWLLKTYVNTNAQFMFDEKGSTTTEGILFDIPGSKYIRGAKKCASEAVIEIHEIKEPKAIALAELARKLELGFWHATYTSSEKALAGKLQALRESKATPRDAMIEGLETISAWVRDTND